MSDQNNPGTRKPKSEEGKEVGTEKTALIEEIRLKDPFYKNINLAFFTMDELNSILIRMKSKGSEKNN